jgi:hypothetical protein
MKQWRNWGKIAANSAGTFSGDFQRLPAPHSLLCRGPFCEGAYLRRTKPLTAREVSVSTTTLVLPSSGRLIIHKFRPDYLVSLANGKTLVLEVKGQDDQQQQTKREFLSEWVRAVNGHGGFGIWAADVSRHPKDVGEILQRNNS